MLAAQRGAAANTLAAYRRDLAGAAAIVGPLAKAGRDDIALLDAAWANLAPSSLARKASAATLTEGAGNSCGSVQISKAQTAGAGGSGDSARDRKSVV